jgi:hypothetical protein
MQGQASLKTRLKDHQAGDHQSMLQAAEGESATAATMQSKLLAETKEAMLHQYYFFFFFFFSFIFSFSFSFIFI